MLLSAPAQGKDSSPIHGSSTRRGRHRCGHDGQRKCVAQMPKAATTTEDSRSKFGRKLPTRLHDEALSLRVEFRSAFRRQTKSLAAGRSATRHVLSGDRLDDTAARCVWADALAASLNGATPQNSPHRPPQPAIAALGANKQTVPTPNPAASAMERTKILTRVIILLLNSDLII